MYVTKGDEHVGACFGGVGILIITIKEKVNNKRVLSYGFEELKKGGNVKSTPLEHVFIFGGFFWWKFFSIF